MARPTSILFGLIFLVILLEGIVCPPVSEKPPKKDEKADDADTDANNLEYERYLREIVSVLESDEMFKKKLEEANISDIKVQLSYQKYLREVFSLLMADKDFAKKMIDAGTSVSQKSGEIAKHLDFVGHGIRSQLDEIKRKEIDRLRQVMRLKTHLQNGNDTALNDDVQDDVNGLKNTHPNIVLPGIEKDLVMGHLDHSNPNTFEIDDLAKLIKKATSDLEEVDRKRRGEFKEYEMEKEMLRQKELQAMDEKQRAEAQKKHEEQEKKHDDHPKLHHPGNEEQLKEVWEESDGLNKNEFDPRTFFNLHDTNGDGLLDEVEIEALFQNELDKVYDPNAPEDDMMERYEEMNRMREHVMNEVDKNGDKLVSLDEFLESTKSKDFKKDEPWEPLDSDEVYSPEEFERFKKEYEEEQLKLQQHPQGDHLGGAPDHRAGVQDMHQQPGHPSDIQHHPRDPNDIQRRPNEPPKPSDSQVPQHVPVGHQPVIDHQPPHQPAVDHNAPQPQVVDHNALQQPVVDHNAPQQPVVDHNAQQQPVIDHQAPQQPVVDHEAPQQPAIDQFHQQPGHNQVL